MDSIRDALLNIDPYDFEVLVAEIWRKQGWEADVTSASRDRGIDVMAKQEEPIEMTVAIQAKAHNEANKITSSMVRNYRTIYEQEEGVDAVAIATTSSFTGDAEELAEDLDMYTLDMDDILHQLASVDIDSFTTILSPFDLNEYDFVDIPHSSDKGGCPQCNTSGSLWEGELEDRQNIMRCEDCGATWKSGADGSWSQIS